MLAGAGEHLCVRLVRPGGGSKLALDAHRRLCVGEDPAVLVVDRTEADADRRWKIFRALSTAEPVVCELTLEAPAVPSGESGLLAELCAAQSLDLAGRSLLVLLPASDRAAGWKHREYRQTVAWLVSDALTRGAAHVVLVGPIGPAADDATLMPLVREAQDVAIAYHCRHLELAELRAEANWTLGDGIIGPDLNATGKAALAKALERWRKP
jgi:hypothetical protein